MVSIKNAARPFGARDKIGYLLGDLGNDFTFILSSSFLLKFYTDVMGVSAFAVGIVIMLSRFVDAFTLQWEEYAIGEDPLQTENSSPGY